MFICEDCKSPMKVEEHDDIGIPVLVLDANGKPYKLAFGDRVHCPCCGKKAITNFGKPTWSYDEKFSAKVAGARRHPAYMEVQ